MTLSMQTSRSSRVQGAATPRHTSQKNTGSTLSIAPRYGFDASAKLVNAETVASKAWRGRTLSPYSLASSTGIT